MLAIVNTTLTRPLDMPDEVWKIERVALAKEPQARFASRLSEVEQWEKRAGSSTTAR